MIGAFPGSFPSRAEGDESVIVKLDFHLSLGVIDQARYWTRWVDGLDGRNSPFRGPEVAITTPKSRELTPFSRWSDRVTSGTPASGCAEHGPC